MPQKKSISAPKSKLDKAASDIQVDFPRMTRAMSLSQPNINSAAPGREVVSPDDSQLQEPQIIDLENNVVESILDSNLPAEEILPAIPNPAVTHKDKGPAPRNNSPLTQPSQSNTPRKSKVTKLPYDQIKLPPGFSSIQFVSFVPYKMRSKTFKKFVERYDWDNLSLADQRSELKSFVEEMFSRKLYYDADFDGCWLLDPLAPFNERDYGRVELDETTLLVLLSSGRYFIEELSKLDDSLDSDASIVYPSSKRGFNSQEYDDPDLDDADLTGVDLSGGLNTSGPGSQAGDENDEGREEDENDEGREEDEDNDEAADEEFSSTKVLALKGRDGFKSMAMHLSGMEKKFQNVFSSIKDIQEIADTNSEAIHHAHKAVSAIQDIVGKHEKEIVELRSQNNAPDISRLRSPIDYSLQVRVYNWKEKDSSNPKQDALNLLKMIGFSAPCRAWRIGVIRQDSIRHLIIQFESNVKRVEAVDKFRDFMKDKESTVNMRPNLPPERINFRKKSLELKNKFHALDDFIQVRGHNLVLCNTDGKFIRVLKHEEIPFVGPSPNASESISIPFVTKNKGQQPPKTVAQQKDKLSKDVDLDLATKLGRKILEEMKSKEVVGAVSKGSKEIGEMPKSQKFTNKGSNKNSKRKASGPEDIMKEFGIVDKAKKNKA
ncbi:hypothetical protein TWF730_009043 [Orbilia blumenaviensis]|uniref:Uncharacterized protein n=1 Tax=Orbilia blumenaviensis TaxID=1796055 RepID=A0AAV9V161_9PEZI